MNSSNQPMKTMICRLPPGSNKGSLLSLGAFLALCLSPLLSAHASTNAPCPADGRMAGAPARDNGVGKGDNDFPTRSRGAGREALRVIFADDFNTERDRPIGLICHTPFAASFAVTNGQLRIAAKFNNESRYNNTGAWCVYPADLGPLEDGDARVMRVDLVSATGPNLMFHLGCHAGSGAYLACVGPDCVALVKTYGAHSFFFVERPRIAFTNVSLSLSLARRGDEVLLTTRIQDKGPGQAVLFEKTVVDTPASDPCLVGKVELENGTSMQSAADPAGDWYNLGRPAVGLWQNADGFQPGVEAVFDNFAVSENGASAPAHAAASSPF